MYQEKNVLSIMTVDANPCRFYTKFLPIPRFSSQSNTSTRRIRRMTLGSRRPTTAKFFGVTDINEVWKTSKRTWEPGVQETKNTK